jgi:hypothetical protein
LTIGFDRDKIFTQATQRIKECLFMNTGAQIAGSGLTFCELCPKRTIQSAARNATAPIPFARYLQPLRTVEVVWLQAGETAAHAAAALVDPARAVVIKPALLKKPDLINPLPPATQLVGETF